MRGIAIILFSFFALSGWSQMYNPVHWTTSLKDNGDGTYSFLASAKIDEGWWVYSQFLASDDGPIATTVNFDEGTHYKLMGKSKESDNAIKMYDKIFEMDVVKFKHSYTIDQKLKITDPSKPITGYLNFQTCNIAGAGQCEFAVPQQKYKAVYLALTSSEGASQLHIVLTYKTSDATKEITLPDYYADLNPADKSLGYLAHDLAKWGNKNNMTEKDHHNIDLLKIETNPGKILKSITIKKDKAGYLVFWAAAGEKT